MALSPYPIIKRLSGKINSPDKLTDGVTPKAKHWLISMVNKLTINDDHFETESAKMAFIWGRTDGLAQSILEPGYTSTDSNRFHTSQDMLDTLWDYFHNPYEVREALHEYNRIMMKPEDSFLDFRSRFV